MRLNQITEYRFKGYRFEVWKNAPRGVRGRLKLYRGASPVELQQKALVVLERLIASSKVVVSREQIWHDVWGPETPSASSNINIDTQISALRSAFSDQDPKHSEFIQTDRNRGFCFMVDVTSHTRDELTSKVTVGERASEVELQDAFDEFFGIRSDDDPPGVIILQSDLLDAKHTQSDSRFFKARNVIDSCDLQGAFFLQKAFKWRPVPRLVVSDHNTQNGLDETVPFKIAMGLGFTDETSRVMESRDYGSWMSISREGGDALSLHEKLKPSLNKSRFRTETDPDPEKPGFVRVLPSDWDAKYIKAWERMLPPKNGPRVSDYAVLLRHTYNRQILFVVAGFTERGTSIGAAHLAANWSKLWEQYVQGNAYKRGLGDFLVLIAGPSDVNCLDSWSEEYAITPETLKKAKIDCEWSRRVGGARPSPRVPSRQAKKPTRQRDHPLDGA